jgi:hypothetical protein
MKSLKEIYEGAVKTNVSMNMGNSNPVTKPDSAWRFLQKYKGVLESKGIKIGDHPLPLGHGELGTAFKLPDNTVLKVTSDPTEAKACRHILGKNFKNVYHINGVYELSDSQIYVIWQEFLDRQTVDDAKEDPRIRSIFYTFKERGTLEKDFPDEKITKYLQYSKLEDSQRSILFKLLHDVRDGLKQLKSVGVNFGDYHFGNILFRKSDDSFVLIDLGVSKSGGVNIDTLEPSEPQEKPQSSYGVPPGV